jgi:hypothetical protein
MAQEHVFVLHKYTSEYDDELTLQTGECITVIEKDDEHGDGWWMVRVLQSFLSALVCAPLGRTITHVGVVICRQGYMLSSCA